MPRTNVAIVDHAHSRSAWMWLLHLLALFLGVTGTAVVTPAQRVEMRSVAKERIQELQRLRQHRGMSDPDYKRKLGAAAREFGLRPRAPLRPRGLNDRSAGDTALVHSRRPISLEDLQANLSAKYRLLDSSGNVLSLSDDPDDLALKVRDALSDGTGRSFYVEMKGFSDGKADALSSSLRIRQHLTDPTVSIEVLPHFEESLVDREDLFTPGITLETEETPIERIDSGNDAGKFKKEIPFSRWSGSRIRHLAVRIVCVTRGLLLEVVGIINSLFEGVAYNADQSLSQLVDGARTEMRKRHPGLTKEQFRIETIRQFGWIGMSQTLQRSLRAWS